MKKNYFTKKRLIGAFFVLLGMGLQAQTYTSWKVGSTTDITTTTTGGMCLMGGGTDNDDAIRWMLQKSGGGDVVVLRSAGTDAYNNYMYSELGVSVNSVETIIIDTRAKASIAAIATKIRNAEALFISGGDQATYVSYWKDTPVEDAINYLINTKQVPVGGTSAGCAILGKFYYSAANSSVTSAQALANPYDTGVTIGVNDFVNSSILANTITDTHYDNPDRRGRQTTFIARMWKDFGAGINAKGIGVYEKTAVCIDQNGIARVFAPTTASFAYFYKMDTSSTPETVTSGTALTWNNGGKGVKILKIAGNTTGSTTFDLNDWTTVSGSNATWGIIKVINGSLTETLDGGSTTTYCASKGNSSSSEWIKKVVIGTINNLSNSNGGYADFSSQSTSITKGVSKTLTLTPGFSATRQLYWKVFIDYNNNGSFTDSGENVYSIFSSATLNPSITVPSSAVVGPVRMRVIVSYNSIGSPCGTYNYGETEDYTLNISSTAKMSSQLDKSIVSPEEDSAVVPARIGIYPNPANVDFNISFKSDVDEKVTVKIFNIQGREEKSFVIDASVGDNRIRTNTSGLSNGQYIVKVVKSNEISTTKLIIFN